MSLSSDFTNENNPKLRLHTMEDLLRDETIEKVEKRLKKRVKMR